MHFLMQLRMVFLSLNKYHKKHGDGILHLESHDPRFVYHLLMRLGYSVGLPPKDCEL